MIAWVYRQVQGGQVELGEQIWYAISTKMSTKSEQLTTKARDSREIAAFISKGLSPDAVAAKVDLPIGYVLELTGAPEFVKDLKRVGGSEAVQRWREYTEGKAANTSLRKRVLSKFDAYMTQLEVIAEGADTKPELRFNVIKFMIERARIGDEAPPQNMAELPPSFFQALVTATQEMDHWAGKKPA